MSTKLQQLQSAEQLACVLALVRYYHEEPNDEANLGFHLDRRMLKFLMDVGAEIDVDEYDLCVTNDADRA